METKSLFERLGGSSGIERIVEEVASRHLENPAIAKARNPREAMNLALRAEETKIESIIRSRRLASSEKSPPSVSAIHGDMTDILPTLTPGTFDLIIADLPYGIGAGGSGFCVADDEPGSHERSSAPFESVDAGTATLSKNGFMRYARA